MQPFLIEFPSNNNNTFIASVRLILRKVGAYETTGKFLVVFVRLILRKVGVDGVTWPRQETDTRYEFDSKVVLKTLGCK